PRCPPRRLPELVDGIAGRSGAASDGPAGRARAAGESGIRKRVTSSGVTSRPGARYSLLLLMESSPWGVGPGVRARCQAVSGADVSGPDTAFYLGIWCQRPNRQA